MKLHSLLFFPVCTVCMTACISQVVTDKDTMQGVQIVPLAEGIQPEEVKIPSGEAVLHGWFLDKKSAWTIMVLHDDKYIFGTTPVLNALVSLPVNILAFDYRGYGFSTGEPTEAGIYADSLAAFDYLVSRGLAPKSIVLYGRRLGASAALEVAGHRETAGIILEATWTSVPAYFKQLNDLMPFYVTVEGKQGELFDNLEKIKKVKVPLLLITSNEKNFMPTHGKVLLDAAASTEKKEVRIDSIIAHEPDKFREQFSLFIDSLKKAGGKDAENGNFWPPTPHYVSR